MPLSQNAAIAAGFACAVYHGSLAAYLGRRFSSRHAPALWSIHNSLDSLANEKGTTALVIRLSAYISRLAAGIIFVSNANKLQHNTLGYSNNNSRIIPNGFDSTLFVPSLETRSGVRAELGLNQ